MSRAKARKHARLVPSCESDLQHRQAAGLQTEPEVLIERERSVVLLLGVMEGVTYFNFLRGQSSLPWGQTIRAAEALLIAAGAPLAFSLQRMRGGAPSESRSNP